METTLQKELEKLKSDTSPQELISSLSHIELTAEETVTAILQAKAAKAKRLEEQAYQERVEANRRLLTNTKPSYTQAKGLALHRAGQLLQQGIFKKPFILDENNHHIFESLCLYFAEDPKFEAQEEGFSLKKGICLVGNPGVGKSWLMTLFSKNLRQCFYVRDCKNIAAAYQQNGDLETMLEEYGRPFPAAFNDPTVFYQSQIGLCLSDIGTEEVKNNYGNKVNVIAEVLYERYKAGLIGPLTHCDMNLTGDQIEEIYGVRIRSRFREMFNWIIVDGEDRRK